MKTIERTFKVYVVEKANRYNVIAIRTIKTKETEREMYNRLKQEITDEYDVYWDEM